MPRDVKGTTEEREQYMADIFRAYYSKPENTGKDLSVNKANEEFKKKYGSMLRNKKTYEIRDAIVEELAQKNGGPPAEARKAVEPKVTTAAREPQMLVPAGSSRAATIVEGTPDQLAWLKGILPQLQQAGLANARIDHATDSYAVVAKA